MATTPQAPYFWAKTDSNETPACAVWQHGFTSGYVAKALIQAMVPTVQSLVPEGTTTLIALHDIGKISPGFQTKCPLWKGPFNDSTPQTLAEWSLKEKSHPTCSQYILQNFLKEKYHTSKMKYWAACAGAHHGRFIDHKIGGTLKPWAVSESIWDQQHHELIIKTEGAFGPLPSAPLPAEDFVIYEFVIGLMSLSDWIASDTSLFSPSPDILPDASAAEHIVNQLGFGRPQCKQGLSWADIFPQTPTPRPLQDKAWSLTARQGVYVLEATMGEGKTEAALGLTYHLLETGNYSGLYFALPTQVTSNRIHLRVREWLDQITSDDRLPPQVRLIHGNSWLQKQHHLGTDARDETASDTRDWFCSSRLAMIKPFGVGTIDQALMGEINVKHSCIRRYALAGKIVILDEVHSYDVYTGSLITSLVTSLQKLGATVIILSATLTAKRLYELLGVNSSTEAPTELPYPLISTKTEEGQSFISFPPAQQKHIRIKISALPEQKTAQEALSRAQQGQCVVWIKNTVAEAQECFKTLRALNTEDGPELGLLHARFTPTRRKELEDNWIERLGKNAENRPRGCVLVATQVVEQSIDIDADWMISELAPSDMLLQRAGRLWRHDRPLACRHVEEPELCIRIMGDPSTANTIEAVQKILGPSGYVYAPFILLRSFKVWRDLNSITLPRDIRPIIEQTYDEQDEDTPIMQELLDLLQKKKRAMILLATTAQAKITSHAGKDDENAFTRLSTVKTVPILLLNQPVEYCPDGTFSLTPIHGNPVHSHPNVPKHNS